MTCVLGLTFYQHGSLVSSDAQYAVTATNSTCTIVRRRCMKNNNSTAQYSNTKRLSFLSLAGIQTVGLPIHKQAHFQLSYAATNSVK